jgi:hypothetical protein
VTDAALFAIHDGVVGPAVFPQAITQARVLIDHPIAHVVFGQIVAVAEVVVFLAFDASAPVSGEVIRVAC